MVKKKDGQKNEQAQNFPAALATATSRNDAKRIDELIREQLATHGKVEENALRIALQQAAKKGHESSAHVLLQHGAKTDITGGKGSPALFWALCQPQTKGHPLVARMLLEAGADVEWRDEKKRSIVQSVAWRGHTEALKLLLEKGQPNLNSVDEDGRTVLHNLGVDKRCRWNDEIIDLILDRPIDVEIKDKRKRTALHWAAATGKARLAQQLLERSPLPGAYISPITSRGKTPLHLVCDSSTENAAEIVQILLKNGADPKMKSDGGWTVLHNAAYAQSSVKVIETLLEASPGLIKARTLTDMTPLHLAAHVGNAEAVKCLLKNNAKINAKDSFYSTPLIRAAHGGHAEICNLLAPYNNLKLSHAEVTACNGFDATIVDFRAGDRSVWNHQNVVQKKTIFETIYGKDEQGKATVTTMVDNIPTPKRATQHSSKPKFRWIHLPANNLSWAEDLIAKAFIEAGCSDADIEGFKAIEKAFNQQHRGTAFHSHFMRPSCQRCPRGTRRHGGEEHLQMFSPLESALRASAPRRGRGSHSTGDAGWDIASSPERPNLRRNIRSNFGSQSTDSGAQAQQQGDGSAPPYTQVPLESIQEPRYEPPAIGENSGGSHTPTPKPLPLGRVDTIESGFPPKSVERADTLDSKDSSGTNRNRRYRRGRGGANQANGEPRPLSRAGLNKANANANANNAIPQPEQGSYISYFQPYLHFETEGRRQQMKAAVHATENNLAIDPRSPDAALVKAFLASTTGLHLRRTLDQYYLKGILDTETRDQDQVVGRFCRRRGLHQSHWKLYMVDQLWMWILGPGLIITAFPQRWQQPKNDPLNMLDGIIEDINDKTRTPVQNVYDLAILISARCCGAFDRHKPGDAEYQFLDIFENSIGNVKDRETALFTDFYDASAQVHRWLSFPGRRESMLAHKYPAVVDAFLDIGKETELLKEIKDIRDELNMISMVLQNQKTTLPSLCEAITKDYFGNYNAIRDIKRRGDEAQRPIDSAMTKITEMRELSEQIEQSLLSLLDLKQKQSNAFEARFSRDAAAGTVRQGQIVMIFTMTTIIFLPISFMAAFFAIPLDNFPRNASGNVTIHLNYVLKYMLPIGVGISLLLIAIAFSVNPITLIFRQINRFFNAKLTGKTAPKLVLYEESISYSEKPPEEKFALDEIAIGAPSAYNSQTNHANTGVGYFSLTRLSKDFRHSMDTGQSPDPEDFAGRRFSDTAFRHRGHKEMEPA